MICDAIRRLTCAALLLLAVGPVWAQSLSKLERVELYGNEYVRLESWAELYNFKCARQGDVVVATSKWSRLVFNINSRQAEIKGVNVHLSVPVARRGEEVFIAPLDLTTTIHPLLYPVQSEAPLHAIAIDAGHGGRDPGNLDGKNQEKKFTLLLAQELQKQLKLAGYKPILIRSTDTYFEPLDRPAQARKQKADLFVSLHFNSAGDTSVNGVETYCMTPAHASSTNARGEGASTGGYDANKFDSRNILLAWHAQKQLVKGLDAADRGVRRARFAVLRFSPVPAVLVEGGYMSNPSEMKKITDPDHRKQMARAITDGINAYKKALNPK
jgi:N-acetylmuramoyl-L-alanine amidase